MKYLAALFALLSLLVIINAHAVSGNTKKKYPYPLLTDDYGILNENDLGAFVWGLKPRPFDPKKDSGPYNYWQCFPRELVTVSLMDVGHSAREFGWRDNIAYLEIDVLMDNGIKHTYEMRANWTIKHFQKRFNKWLGLMKGEKYVCLAGSFVRQTRKAKNGQAWETNGWIFEKLKTKKGCDSYFDSCTPTYAEYLRQKK